MSAANWERWARAAGGVFVVLIVLAFIVAGEAPTVTDSADDVISYYDGNRGEVLVSAFLFTVGWILFLWFGAAIANLLRERGEGRVAATVIATASVLAAVQVAAATLQASLAYSIARDGDAGVVQAFFDLGWAIDVLAAVPSAAFILAVSVGLMRIHGIPTWLSWAGVALTALFALRSTNWASEGFWSPSGGFLFVLIPCALLWILTTSLTLFLRAPSVPTIERRRTDAALEG